MIAGSQDRPQRRYHGAGLMRVDGIGAGSTPAALAIDRQPRPQHVRRLAVRHASEVVLCGLDQERIARGDAGQCLVRAVTATVKASYIVTSFSALLHGTISDPILIVECVSGSYVPKRDS
jgi:hypothetical protein